MNRLHKRVSSLFLWAAVFALIFWLTPQISFSNANSAKKAGRHSTSKSVGLARMTLRPEELQTVPVPINARPTPTSGGASLEFTAGQTQNLYFDIRGMGYAATDVVDMRANGGTLATLTITSSTTITNKGDHYEIAAGTNPTITLTVTSTQAQPQTVLFTFFQHTLASPSTQRTLVFPGSGPHLEQATPESEQRWPEPSSISLVPLTIYAGHEDFLCVVSIKASVSKKKHNAVLIDLEPNYRSQFRSPSGEWPYRVSLPRDCRAVSFKIRSTQSVSEESYVMFTANQINAAFSIGNSVFLEPNPPGQELAPPAKSPGR